MGEGAIMMRLGSALFAVLIAASAAAQEFTPRELEDMVKSGFAGCMKTQLNLSANAGAPRSLVEEYCRCTAHKLAARTTRAECQAEIAN
jgi:hypothetical protein